MQKIDLTQDFSMPVADLFARLSEHENLEKLFSPARITRLNDGKDCRNGVGSKRRLNIPLAPLIEETVTVYQPNERIEYRISNNTPLTNHLGVMHFQATDNGSRLHYTITFESPVPLLGGLVRLMLTRAISKGLASDFMKP